MLILEKNECFEYDIESVKLFIENNTLKKYLMGRNEYSKELLKILKIDGIIDDFTKEIEFQGIPVIKLENVDLNSIIVSCSNLRPITAKKSIDKYGIRNIDSFLFWKISRIKLKSMNYMEEHIKDLEENFEKYKKIYNLLCDEKSKEIFYNIINFRNSMKIEYLKFFEYNIEKQYFEEILKFGKEEVFVDAGGFDGITTKEFINRCNNYKAVHIFEPDPVNIKNAKENLKEYKNINFYEKGLGNKKEILSFEAGSGSSSKIDKNGDIKISIDTLDNMVSEKISFIKMDIEGAEENAIEGAKNHILNDCPKMAICVYHKKDDFWKIPEKIIELTNEYKIYLRHYTEGIHETVMFFIPSNKRRS